MKQALSIFALATVALGKGVNHHHKKQHKLQDVPNETTIPTYKIDMSLPAEQRFVEVAKAYEKPINAIFDYAQSQIGWIGVMVAQYIWSFDALIPPMQPERYHEIKGMFNSIGLETWKGMALNYVYEYGAYCTSIIARKENGDIIHGRNLDFHFAPYIRNLTYKAEFWDGDVHKYDAIMFAGHMGVFTAMKPGAFSVSEDDRMPSHEKNLWGLLENMILIFAGFDEVSWTIRKTLDQCDSYGCAVEFMKTSPVISPGYIIVGGVHGNEGAIISRDRFGPAHVDEITDENWYVVQTNSDHWKGICGDRCVAAKKNLDKVGEKNITLDTLRHEVMYQHPNFNDITLYNSMISAKEGYMDTNLMFYPNPPPYNFTMTE